MSLSTLLEAAKYLDYLDSNKNNGGQQLAQSSPPQFQASQQTQPAIVKKGTRRQKSSRKDAANTMLAMSLPVTSGTLTHQGVPIPLASTNHHHQTASLSSSFTESPLSSFASTALLCSKVSGVTSASSSAASSLSSSDSSSSCGEIHMGDNDFNQISPGVGGDGKGNNQLSTSFSHQQQSANNQPRLLNKLSNDANQSFSHYLAATSAGPQLVTMTSSSSGLTSASAPIEGRVRAGHVIHAAAINASVAGTGFDPRQFAITTLSGSHRSGDGQSYGHFGSSLGNENHSAGSPLIMARVQPMITHSMSPSAQSIMTAQQQTMIASSPTSSTSSYSRHRELHKTLEKNRRAHLRHCFELLKAELPASDCVVKKTSHINIIMWAIRYVLALRQQESEIDNELQRLTKIKKELTEKLSKVRNEQQHQAAVAGSSSHMALSPASPEPSSQQQQQSQPSSPPSSLSKLETTANKVKLEQISSKQQPAAEHQLSFLLSQSKID